MPHRETDDVCDTVFTKEKALVAFRDPDETKAREALWYAICCIDDLDWIQNQIIALEKRRPKSSLAQYLASSVGIIARFHGPVDPARMYPHLQRMLAYPPDLDMDYFVRQALVAVEVMQFGRDLSMDKRPTDVILASLLREHASPQITSNS